MAKVVLEDGRCHLMLEKPPCATIAECHVLKALADQKGLSLYATWHSREADQMDRAQEWLRDNKNRQVQSIDVTWKKDVRMWHPGQTWIWLAGNLGVFDPGINPLSILTKILPEELVVRPATLTLPSNQQTPIAAIMDLRTVETNAPCHVELDWRQTGKQTWEIRVDTNQGSILLS
jgi:D-galactose 1-dehydrogenase